MKTCTHCNTSKNINQFSRNGKYRHSRCKSCSKIYAHVYQEKNKERLRIYHRDKGRDLRRLVLQKYGDKCVCCNESTPEFLSIDHINGGGNKHRQSLGKNGTKGGSFYLWLRRNNFPKEGFQLLCHNCNFAKGHYSMCPHARSSE